MSSAEGVSAEARASAARLLDGWIDRTNFGTAATERVRTELLPAIARALAARDAELERLRQRAEESEADLADWEETIRKVNAEACADEPGSDPGTVDHCTCVGPLREAVRRASAERDALRERVAKLSVQKDCAYLERDRLVAALSKVWPSRLARHPDEDESWDDDWRWIVFIDLPTGQASWHIHDDELPMFAHLDRVDGNPWDGHTTDEKYARLAALPTPEAPDAR